MSVVLIGTMDTKGREVAYVRDLLRAVGLDVRTIDAGTGGDPVAAADVSRDEVLDWAGTSMEEIAANGDRGRAVASAARGVAAIVGRMAAEGRVDGVLALGGSAGTVIGTSAMRAVPFGVPKVMVSTLASGQTRPYVGESDLIMVPAVADLAGLNRVTRTVLRNAAHAMVGMVTNRSTGAPSSDGPLVTATMFGVTTPCVQRAAAALEAAGAEVIVYHATGTGGRSMERLIRDGLVDAVFDLTTTELADELVGGILSAGPDRLKAAVEAGLPQVVSVGALDMVNFGPMETVPDAFRGRLLHVHNPTVTLMRTTAAEAAAIGLRMAEILRPARAPTLVLLPEGGVSALDAPDRPFWDPAADAALFVAIRLGLDGAEHARVETVPHHINDPAFADLAAGRLLELLPRRSG